MNFKEAFDRVVGCDKFVFPCWASGKLGFDGLCLSFNLPCLFYVFGYVRLNKKIRKIGVKID